MGVKSLWLSNAVTFTKENRPADSAKVEMFLSLINDVCWGKIHVSIGSLTVMVSLSKLNPLGISIAKYYSLKN